MSTEAANAIAEYLRLFVVEAVQRCSLARNIEEKRRNEFADDDDDDAALSIEPVHLEKVLHNFCSISEHSISSRIAAVHKRKQKVLLLK